MNELLTHPIDADLLRYLDSETSDIERRAVQDHLEDCPQCSEVLRLFREGTVAVEDLLMSETESDVPVSTAARRIRTPKLVIIERDPAGRSWHTQRSMRAAILIIGLAAVALTVSPVRGWVAELLRFNHPAPVEQSDAPAGVQRPAPVMTSSIAFVPRGPGFVIAIREPQATGTLTLVPGPGTRAQGSVMGQDLDVALFVTDVGLGITNSLTSSVSYRIQVPESVRDVVVRIHEIVAGRIERRNMLEPIVIPLDSGARSRTNP